MSALDDILAAPESKAPDLPVQDELDVLLSPTPRQRTPAPPAQDELETILAGGIPREEVPTGVGEEITAGLRRGGLGLSSSLASFVGLGAGAIGLEEAEQDIITQAREYEKRAAAIPSAVESFEDIAGAGDAGIFVVKTLAENAPMLATLFLGGIAPAVGAKVLGAGAGATKAAGVAGAALTDFAILTGETAGGIEGEQPGAAQANIHRVLATGAAKTALDFVPFFALAKKMGLAGRVEGEVVEQLVQKGFVRRSAENMLTLAVTEIPTETLQEVLDVAAERAVFGREGDYTDEELHRFKGAAAGAAAFSVLGIPAAVVSKKHGIAPPDKAFGKQPDLATKDPTQQVPDAVAMEELFVESEQTLRRLGQEAEVAGVEDVAATLPVFKGGDAETTVIFGETAMIDNVGAEPTPYNQAPVQPGEVKAVTYDVNEDLAIEYAEIKIREAQEQLDALKLEVDVTNPLTAELVEGAQIQLKQAKEHKDTLVLGQRKKRVILRSVREQVQAWVTAFAPDMKMLVSDGTLGVALSNQGVLPARTDSHAGWSYALPDGTRVIEVAHAVQQRQGLSIGAVQAFAAHEFGHAFSKTQFNNASEHVRKAVYNEYLQWRKDLTSLTAKEFARKWVTPYEAKQFPLPEKFHDMSALEYYGTQYIAEYRGTFDEYLADQMARYSTATARGRGLATRWFKQVANVLRRWFKRFGKDFAPGAAFEAWVDRAYAETELAKVTEQEATVPKMAPEPTHTEVPTEELEVQDAINYAPPEVVKEYKKDLQGDKDWYNKGVKLGATLLQIAKRNSHIPAVQEYVQSVRNWWNEKTLWTARADERIKGVQKLGRARADAMFSFAYDVTLDSDKLGRKLTEVELAAWAEKHKLDEEQVEVFHEIESDYVAALEKLERVTIKDIRRTFAESPTAMEQAMAKNAADFAQLRNRNYFPLPRFGDFTVTVTAHRVETIAGTKYNIGDIISFETFESKREMLARERELKREFTQHGVANGKLPEIVKSFQGLPGPLVDSLKGKLDLTATQREELNQMIHQLSPAQSFKKSLLERKSTKGFSTDGLRAYANYFQRFANHIARMEHHAEMQDAIRGVTRSAQALARQSESAFRRDEIRDHLQRHYDYVMNPTGELANYRAVAFLWYLGFLPKSALVNLTQVPLVAYPYLSSRYGDVSTVGALTKAMKDAFKMWKNPEAIEPALDAALKKAVAEGFIDESLATEVAGVSEGSFVQRMVPGGFIGGEKAARNIRTFAHYGAYLFQQAEKLNRRVTFIAAWRLGRKQGMSDTAAFEAARDAVDSTQYEYARWNRPEFMRGNKSVIFVFWQYMQNTLYFARYEQGRGRFLMMMFLLGGLMGEPFMENILDMIDFAGNKFWRAMGMPGKKMDSKMAVRQFIQKELGEFIPLLQQHPDLMMYGASRYSFGLPQIGEMVGIPIPNVDLSGSLSLGRLIPGTEALGSSDFKSGFLKASTDVGGAAIAIPIAFAQALADDNPDQFKRWERAMPSALRSISRAFRFGREGEERSRTGETIVEFDTGNPQHMAEIIAQALGAAPTRLNVAQEARWAEKEAVRFYETRRRIIMQMFAHAKFFRDGGALKEARKEVRAYNASVPFAGLKISARDLGRSIKQRRKNILKGERGLAKSKRFQQLTRDVQSAFPEQE